jgi:pimeloyl-ACP methyl ester carboxylesterase
MGGTVASIFAGLFPEKTSSLTSIEDVGIYWQNSPQPGSISSALRQWVQDTRSLAGRIPKRYPDFAAALQRLMTSNSHLSDRRAHHLTADGTNQNEDSSFSWKFDNYTHSQPSSRLSTNDMIELWEQVNCPTLLMNARQGFEHRIGQDNTAGHFNSSAILNIDQAGHWLHHDQFDLFIQELKLFLANST